MRFRPNALIFTSASVGLGVGTADSELMKRASIPPLPPLMSTAFMVFGADMVDDGVATVRKLRLEFGRML